MSQLKSFRDLKVYQKLLTGQRFNELDARCDECGRMLEGLHQALSVWRGTTRTGTVVREDRAAYDSEPGSIDFGRAIEIALQCEEVSQ